MEPSTQLTQPQVVQPASPPNIPNQPNTPNVFSASPNKPRIPKLLLFVLLAVILFGIGYAGIYGYLNAQVDKVAHEPKPTPSVIQSSPTCMPRPKCLDAKPACLMPESENMCPPTSPTTTQKETACTQEAKICADGSSVGRSGPNCQFDACPGERCGGLNGQRCSIGYTCFVKENYPDAPGTCVKQ